MKSFLYFLIATTALTACGKKITIETAENFEQVELPDSSVVYLNHNSKLTYDEAFNPRKVKLTGEAFFSVNDGETPFVIETEEGDEVTVLGTEFALMATKKGIGLEVEIGAVTLRVLSGKMFRKVRRGQRIDYGRHDNGLHLGHAKHRHRSWITVMDRDFKKSGIFLKHSPKHRGNFFKHGPGKGNKPYFKGGNPKGPGGKPKGGNLKGSNAKPNAGNTKGSNPKGNTKGGGGDGKKGKN